MACGEATQTTRQPPRRRCLPRPTDPPNRPVPAINTVPFLPACAGLPSLVKGKSYEAVIENIKDVIALCLAEMKERGERIPPQPEIIGITGHRPGTSAQDPAGHRARPEGPVALAVAPLPGGFHDGPGLDLTRTDSPANQSPALHTSPFPLFLIAQGRVTLSRLLPAATCPLPATCWSLPAAGCTSRKVTMVAPSPNFQGEKSGFDSAGEPSPRISPWKPCGRSD